MGKSITDKEARKNLSLLNVLTFLAEFRAFEGVIAVYFYSITGSFSAAFTVLATLSISAMIFEVPTGVLSDRIGRKKTLILAYTLGSLAIGCYWLSDSLVMLMGGAVILGIGMAFKSGTISAFVYENLEIIGEKNFSKHEGHRQSLGRFALVAAGILGTLGIFLYDMRLAVLITFIVTGIAAFLSFFLTDIEKPSRGSTNVYKDLRQAYRFIMKNQSLRNISIGKMIMVGGGNFEYRMRSLFFAGLFAEWVVNLLGMINNFIAGQAMRHTHKIVEKIGFKKSLVLSGIVDRVSTTVFVLLNTIPGAWIMTTITSTVFGLRMIASEDLLQARYSKEQRATMGSIVGLGGSIVYSILSITAGFVADQIGVIYTIILVQPILILSSYFYFKGISASKD